ncbi:MAG: hypothetical protein AAGG55_03455 [Pseudomonadota bacterium]
MSNPARLKLPRIPRKGYLGFGDVYQWLGITYRQLHAWLRLHPSICASSAEERVKRFYKSDLEKLRLVHSAVVLSGMSHQDADEALADPASYKPSLYGGLPARNPRQRRTMRLSAALGVSEAKLAELTGVHLETARRYLSAGEAPYAIAELLELKLTGRVLPQSWNHCFINQRGNLEINGVGEVCENDVLHIEWARRLHHSHVQTLERELLTARSRITDLECKLNDAHSEEIGFRVGNDPVHKESGE